MQQMNFVDDEKTNELRQFNVASALPRDNVPFLRRCHQHLLSNVFLFIKYVLITMTKSINTDISVLNSLIFLQIPTVLLWQHVFINISMPKILLSFSDAEHILLELQWIPIPKPLLHCCYFTYQFIYKQHRGTKASYNVQTDTVSQFTYSN